MIEPVAPFQLGIFDSFESAPWTTPVDHLGFVQAVDRLGQSVVTAVANAADRRLDPGLGKLLGVLDRHVLGGFNRSLQRFETEACDGDQEAAFGPAHQIAAAIAVMSQAATVDPPALMKRLLERIQDEAGMCCPVGTPSDDPAGIGVDDKGDVDETAPSHDVGKVRHPSTFGAGA